MSAELDRIDAAIERYPRALEPLYSLFSGGYDSLAACLVAEKHPRFAGVVHIATGTGVDETRDYVHEVARLRGWPLREYEPEGRNTFESIVREFGMPGPGFHQIPYTRLKERQLERLTRELKDGHPRLSNILLVSGVRAAESARRKRNADRPMTKVAARVFAAPIFDWSKADCRRLVDASGLPENPVVATIHKSGECLCGAFGSQAELEELAFWWPAAAQRIFDWQKLAHSLGKHWKWGTRPSRLPAEQQQLWEDDEAPPPGPLCQSCHIQNERAA